MQDEYDALIANDTWSLVPQPPGVNVVTDKWIFRHKLLADGSLLIAIRLAGFSGVLHSDPVLIMMRPSVRWLSQRQFEWFSLWPLSGLPHSPA
jgi:hypothetical protein